MWKDLYNKIENLVREVENIKENQVESSNKKYNNRNKAKNDTNLFWVLNLILKDYVFQNRDIERYQTSE